MCVMAYHWTQSKHVQNILAVAEQQQISTIIPHQASRVTVQGCCHASLCSQSTVQNSVFTEELPVLTHVLTHIYPSFQCRDMIKYLLAQKSS